MRSFQSTDKHSFHIAHVWFARRFLLQMCGELLQVAVCVTQLIFHHDKTFAQLKLKASPAYTKWGSFPKPVSFFLSICLCLSPALSIHPPDVTYTQIKRDVQFPVPSCSGKRQSVLFSTLLAEESVTLISIMCFCVLSASQTHQRGMRLNTCDGNSCLPLCLQTVTCDCVFKGCLWKACGWREARLWGHHKHSSLPPWAVLLVDI